MTAASAVHVPKVRASKGVAEEVKVTQQGTQYSLTTAVNILDTMHDEIHYYSNGKDGERTSPS